MVDTRESVENTSVEPLENPLFLLSFGLLLEKDQQRQLWRDY